MDDPRPAAVTTVAAPHARQQPQQRVFLMRLQCASPSWSVVSAWCGAAAGVALLLLVAWMARQARHTGCCAKWGRRQRQRQRRGPPRPRAHSFPREHLQPALAPAPPPRPSPRIFVVPPQSPVDDEGYVTPTTKTALRHSYMLVLTDDQQMHQGFSHDGVENVTHPRPAGACSGEPGYLPMRNYPITSTCEQVLRIFQENGIAVEMAAIKGSPHEPPLDADLGISSQNLTSFQPHNPTLKDPASPYTVTGMNLPLKDLGEYVGRDQPYICPNTTYPNLHAESLPCKADPNLIQSRLLPAPPRPRPPASLAIKKEEN